MASEEDNFDIDIYGDGGEEYQQELAQQTKEEPMPPLQMDGLAEDHPLETNSHDLTTSLNGYSSQPVVKGESPGPGDGEIAQKIASTDHSAIDTVQLPKRAPQTQGIKRKEGQDDDRSVDPGATTALFVSELHWWITDDDIRGWANQSQCEDELEDITFSEHKVNGKSKGQTYVLFKSAQAATAVKQKIETFGGGQQYAKKFTVSYSNPLSNPFKTLPKDGPMRNNASTNNNRSNVGSMQSYAGGGFRGGRGGNYNNRGGAVGGGANPMSTYNRGGFQQQMGGFQNSGMGGFPSMNGMQSYGGFQNRGGMMGGMRGGGMGMRGGRGGLMGMPMNMGMGAMGMSMGMPQMGGVGITGANGFQGNQNNFNPTIFQQQGSPGYGSGENPHAAKRARQD